VPLEEDVFWFGPTDQWDAKNADITAEARTDLERALTSMINLPFSVESHLAALRPTTPDRRPLLGTHHLNPKVHIFNGLGTKGASLAPYWAQKMVDYLVLGKRLPWEVDVKRFTEDSTSYRNR
ncbi:MAG: FAD-dependent oxidoreductase, partial [Saprospiraceae bacterium]|nr:FAD-dependent oxidoreductase [Saprospiraceae bacterium]